MKTRIFLLILCAFVPSWFIPPVDAVQENSDRSQAYYHYLLGTLAERSRELSEAITEYREALRYDPRASEIYARLADLYIQTNRTQEAIREAEESIKQDPGNKEAHKMLGQIYLEQVFENDTNPENAKKAIQEFQEVRKLDSQDDSVLLSLGQLYLQTNQPKSAVEVLGKYIEVIPDSSIAIATIATAYQQLNQNDLALSYMEKYSDLNPDNLYVLQQMSTLFEKKGDYQQALELQRRVYQAEPDDPAIVRRYVDLLGRVQDYPEAIRILEQKSGPRSSEWTVLLAKTLQKSGNQERAEDVLEERIVKEPNDVDLQLALVQIYEDGNKYPDALKILERMNDRLAADTTADERERRANQILVYSHLGYAAQKMKEYDRSIEFYQKARALVDPSDTPKIDFYIALNYRGQQKWDQAIEILNTIVDANANDTGAWELLSLVYEEKGDQADSDRVVQHLIDTHPDSADYFLLKAQRLQQREKFDESIVFLNTMLPKFASNDQVFFLLGAAYERLKNIDKAEEFLKQSIALNAQNANALNYLGYMLIDKGIRVEEGMQYIKQALELDRGNGAFLDSLGWGYFKLNKFDLAEDNLRMALEQLDDNAVVHDHMGDLYFKLGKFREAIEQWEAALKNKTDEIDPEFLKKKIDDTRNRLQ